MREIEAPNPQIDLLQIRPYQPATLSIQPLLIAPTNETHYHGLEIEQVSQVPDLSFEEVRIKVGADRFEERYLLAPFETQKR